jgi:hypothetical protein
MKMYIAIFAACASTLAMAQTDIVRADPYFEMQVKLHPKAPKGPGASPVIRGGRENEENRSKKRSGGKSGQHPSGYIGNPGWGQRGK